MSTTSAAAETPHPPLDLCRPPDLPPADLLSKPGYRQFSVTATDAQGNPITGLKQSDFTVQSGSQSEPVAYFREESSTKTPVSVVIVADLSETMYEKTVVTRRNVGLTRAAIQRAMENLNVCDEIAVVTVGGTQMDPRKANLSPVTYLQPFTTNPDLALSATYTIKPSGEKLLSDGVRMGLSAVGDSHYSDRAMVILTDGLETKSTDESVRILEAVPRGSFSLWVLGIGDPEASANSVTGARRLNTEAVKRLAQAGGGQALFAQAIEADGGASLAAAINTIEGNLARSYAVGVVVPPTAGSMAVSLARQLPGANVASTLIPSQMLTAAAERPERVAPGRCVAATQVPPSISSQTDFNLFDVTVTGPSETPVEGLKQSDFAAACSGKPCPIAYFATANCAIKSVLITIDTSGSMQRKLETVAQDVGSLIDKLNPDDQVGLIAFSSKAYMLHSLDTSHAQAKEKLAMLHAYGQTTLYDTLKENIRLLERVNGSAAMVLITDGRDNTSQTSLDSLLADLKSSGIVVYVIGIGNPNNSGSQGSAIGPFVFGGDIDALDPAPLEAIAAASGGKSFIVSEFDADRGQSFANAITSITEDLNSGTHYVIGVVGNTGGAPFVLSTPKHPELKVNANRLTVGGSV